MTAIIGFLYSLFKALPAVFGLGKDIFIAYQAHEKAANEEAALARLQGKEIDDINSVAVIVKRLRDHAPPPVQQRQDAQGPPGLPASSGSGPELGFGSPPGSPGA